MAAAGDVLIRRILASDGDRGTLANRLLAEFFGGYPTGRLQTLLRSSDHEVVSTGAWILSELGSRARALLREAAPLLQHPNQRARFWALDFLLGQAAIEDVDLVLQCVRSLDDSHSAVRWKTMEALAYAPAPLLRAALEVEQQRGGDSAHARGLSLLVQRDGSNHTEDAMRSEEPLLRRYAAVACARSGPDHPCLRLASESADADVAGFAADMIERNALRTHP